MKTVKINNAYVRIAAIESVNVHYKNETNKQAIVGVLTRQLCMSVGFDSDSEADKYVDFIVGLMNV